MIPLPTVFKITEKKDNYAQFVLEALYPGYGITIGNTLRRALYSSLGGAAVTEVKIKEVQHEFSTIQGVIEDVIHICLNLKKLRFKMFGDEPIRATLRAGGQKKVKAGDFDFPSQLELINKNQHIATLTKKDAVLEIEIIVRKGVGYETREMRLKEKLPAGLISLDAIYTPIRRVNFHVENIRFGERTDFDRLFISIETDGTIQPEEAFLRANDILIKHFLFINEESAKVVNLPVAGGEEIKKETAQKEKQASEDIFKKPVADLKISKRTINSLEGAGVKTVGGLIKKKEKDLLEMEGLGEKGLKEIKKALKKMGMEIKAD